MNKCEVEATTSLILISFWFLVLKVGTVLIVTEQQKYNTLEESDVLTSEKLLAWGVSIF